MDWSALLMTCAPLIDPITAHALIHVESNHNPFAIGVVAGSLQRQPRTLEEAVATVRALAADGWDYSAGPGQINQRNWARLGLDARSAFDPCSNLRAMQTILAECFSRAHGDQGGTQLALHRALSCYYSGNFTTGFARPAGGPPSYVEKVVSAAASARKTLQGKGER